MSQDPQFHGRESRLKAASKRQNRISEYRRMLLAWKAIGVMTYAGYILGFPADTPESILRDIRTIQRELPIDLLEFFFLTPLPGSEDHRQLHLSGTWMEPDLNNYDVNHVTTRHPLMSRENWERAYRLAWETYYSPDHIETVMRRSVATGSSAGKALFLMLWFYACITLEKVHPLEGGYLRLKFRRDRRPGLPVESPLVFYPRYLGELVVKHARMFGLWWKLNRIRRRIKADPNRRTYMDEALTPVTEDEPALMEISAAD